MKHRTRLIFGLAIGAAIIATTYLPIVYNSTIGIASIALVNILYGTVIILARLKYYNFSRLVLTVTPSISTLLIGNTFLMQPDLLSAMKLTIFCTIILPLLTIGLNERVLMTIGLTLILGSFYSCEWISREVIAPLTKPVEFAPPIGIAITPLLDISIVVYGFLYSQNLVAAGRDKIFRLIRDIRGMYGELLEQRKIEAELQIDAVRLKALSSQMNPHFVYNALNAIQYYILKYDRKTAYDYLAKFSHLIRQSLENLRSETVKLDAELTLIRNYLDLQLMRLEQQFSYEICLSADVQGSELYLPTMILQPLVENAVIHGLQPRPVGGRLRISVESNDKSLVLVVEDNGVGISCDTGHRQDRNSLHKSAGLEIVNERINLLQKTLSTMIKFRIENLIDESFQSIGTRATVMLPVLREHPN